MAEGFARAYGSDVMSVQSAGLSPAIAIAPLTQKVMLEKNIDLGGLHPKSLNLVEGDIDLVINMSGYPAPLKIAPQVEEWPVHDPIGESEDVFRRVRDEIEQRVMRLILGMRTRKPPQSADRTILPANSVKP